MKLNDGKIEVGIVRGMILSIRADDLRISVVDGVSFIPADSVGNLGVVFDDFLNFVKHVNLVVRDCNYLNENCGCCWKVPG